MKNADSGGGGAMPAIEEPHKHAADLHFEAYKMLPTDAGNAAMDIRQITSAVADDPDVAVTTDADAVALLRILTDLAYDCESTKTIATKLIAFLERPLRARDHDPMAATNGKDTPPCPVAAIARELATVLPESGDDWEHDGDRRDRAELLSDRSTFLVPRSPLGALLQVHLLSEFSEEYAGREDGDHLRERARRKVNRLLYSLQTYLAEMGGIDPSAARDDWYLSPKRNPFKPTADAVGQSSSP